MNILNLIGREKLLFVNDIQNKANELKNIVSNSKFLVLGGAGSIGQAVVKEIFKRNPQKLHVVDISENNLAELVRDIRSSYGYINGDFKTFALDINSAEYDVYWKKNGDFDYILNLSALKHVRSEKDPYTLMRMIQTNIFNTDKTLRQAIEKGVKKYFCVSTDKAANPVNMMGASKRIMEMFVHRKSKKITVSMARFANVAFSDGSLLHSFNNRLQKRQPIVAPSDIKRYFVVPQEAGELCLMSTIFGDNRDIFFPKLNKELNLITFSDIAINYLKQKEIKPYICKTEKEAREKITIINEGYYPCLFTKSDTTGEKDFEEFYTENEVVDLKKFENIGIIKNDLDYNEKKLLYFENRIKDMLVRKDWDRKVLISLFKEMLPNFKHKEKGKSLDEKM